ncbi:MAG: 50S ribosomal protein L11 methyltransferase [Prevotellaceae bacterium]|jgi:ribosomal protein L11 methyltransferase|nr:50S ribosomal protein L11 methyltransferase [Prevotellaceae bacterium]
MKYVEYTFQTSPCNQTVHDVLAALLADIGFESFVEQEEPAGLLAYAPCGSFTGQQLDELVATFPLDDTSITYRAVEIADCNWNQAWEQHFFQPLVVDDRCVVHSTFHTSYPPARYELIINPQMAFGTGHHETTRLILTELLDADVEGKNVLDMGCGTAILAILARLRGAAHCLAVDIDEWCVRNAAENIRLNKLEGITVMQGDASLLPAEARFEVVLANINRNVLLADMAHYARVMRAGAELYLSGFYREDVPLLQAEAERCGLQWEQVREQNRWSAAKCRKAAE